MAGSTRRIKAQAQGAGAKFTRALGGSPLPVDISTGSEQGVGGDSMLSFQIGIAQFDSTGKPKLKDTERVHMELAPARRSFYDKSGQQTPGAGAGLQIRAKTNLAKLNVPGSRPIYQMMGIAEETLEFCGAFIGRDVEDGHPMSAIRSNGDGPLREKDAPGCTGWAQSNALTNIFRRGREVCILLQWTRQVGHNDYTHAVGFQGGYQDSENFVWYTGFIKEFERAYATEHRVYYRVSLVVTNRHDVNRKINEAAPISLPDVFRIGIPSDAQVKTSQINAERNANPNKLRDAEVLSYEIAPAGTDGDSLQKDKPAAMSTDKVNKAIGVVNRSNGTEIFYNSMLTNKEYANAHMTDMDEAMSTLKQMPPGNQVAAAGVTKLERVKAELLKRQNEKSKVNLSRADERVLAGGGTQLRVSDGGSK